MTRTAVIQDQFARLVANNRLAHAYLLAGRLDSDKIALAKWIAQAVFCTNRTDGRPCQECPHCQRIAQDDFLDVHVIVPEGQSLKVDQIRAMKADAAFSSMENPKKVYIIDQIETMSQAAANSLLKVLEEPMGEVYFLLLTQNKGAVLPTIRSRCQLINCQQDAAKSLEDLLRQQQVAPQLAYLLSRVVSNEEEALALSQDDDFKKFQDEVVKWADLVLKKDPLAYVQVATRLSSFLSKKDWARMGLDIFMLVAFEQYEVGRNLKDQPLLTKGKARLSGDFLALTSQAKTYLAANVTGNSVYEWLVLQMR